MDLSLRKMTNRDLPFVNKVRNGYAAEFLHDSRTFTLGETKDWFYKTKPSYQIVYYDRKRTGYIRITDYSERNKNIVVGVDIAPEYTGRGIGKMVYEKLLDIFFNEYKLHKISLEVLETNTTAINLYQKVGFVEDGRKRDEVYKNGQWVDSIIMSILSTEYNKKSKQDE